MKEQEVLQNFIDQVRSLYEPEFGDLKRKVGLYIDRLEESLEKSNEVKGAGHVLTKMKTSVVYNPNGDIESTRRQVIQMAHELLGRRSGSLH